jgi:rhodanese-related sulfurtransferase
MRRALRQIIALLLLALVPAFGAAIFHPRRPAWRSDEITLAVAQGWREKILWLDARPRADYERGHIPGALLLNEEEWNALLPEMLDEWNGGRVVVVYCSSLSCQASRDVARRLREEVGLPDVYVLQGGWEKWRSVQK